MTPLQPHQRRVVEELRRLNEKRERLRVFIEAADMAPIFPTLPEDEQGRLKKQYDIMNDYAEILKERIDAFPKPEPVKVKMTTREDLNKL